MKIDDKDRREPTAEQRESAKKLCGVMLKYYCPDDVERAVSFLARRDAELLGPLHGPGCACSDTEEGCPGYLAHGHAERDLLRDAVIEAARNIVDRKPGAMIGSLESALAALRAHDAVQHSEPCECKQVGKRHCVGADAGRDCPEENK